MAQLPELRQRIDHLIKRYLQNLDQGTLDILAAGGYSNGEQLAACDADGITVILPNQRSIDDLSNGYPKSAYTYDADQDCYICPAGERLIHKTVSRKEKRDLYTREGCHTCVLKPKCTKAKKRRVGWHFSEDVF